MLSLLSLSLSLSLQGSTNGAPKLSPASAAKSLEKSMVQVGDNLYASKFEVKNIDYREFMNTIDKGSEEFQKFQVDSMNWNRKMAYGDPYVESYYNHPAFYGYPVLNVPYEGAVKYCEWLTNIYHQNPKRQFQKVIFRLPTEKEWESVARKGFSEENQTDWPILEDKKGRQMVNYRQIRQYSIKTDSESGELVVDTSHSLKTPNRQHFYVSAPVDALPTNELGIYHMFGNASEMIAEEGKSKGGSWWTTGYDLKIDAVQEYDQPSPFIGFRVFMEVVEE